MNSVYVLSRTDSNYDQIIEIISAHSTKRSAEDAERFYRNYVATQDMKTDGLFTDIREVTFEV